MTHLKFEEIYEMYFKDVYKFMLSICHFEQIAEEITQDTFYRAMQNFEQFRGECKIQVWLCQIAKHTYFKYKKKQSKIVDIYDIKENQDESIEIVYLQKERIFELHKILHCLTEPYKEVFSLRVFSELSYRDIGVLFSETESWARVTFHRAKLIVINKIKEGNNGEGIL